MAQEPKDILTDAECDRSCRAWVSAILLPYAGAEDVYWDAAAKVLLALIIESLWAVPAKELLPAVAARIDRSTAGSEEMFDTDRAGWTDGMVQRVDFYLQQPKGGRAHTEAQLRRRTEYLRKGLALCSGALAG